MHTTYYKICGFRIYDDTNLKNKYNIHKIIVIIQQINYEILSFHNGTRNTFYICLLIANDKYCY